MSETTAPENIIPLPVEAPAAAEAPAVAEAPADETPKPQTIQELVAAIDIAGVSEHEIIVDLISGIQQLALRGTIALGLLERLKVEAEAEAAAPESADEKEA